MFMMRFLKDFLVKEIRVILFHIFAWDQFIITTITILLVVIMH